MSAGSIQHTFQSRKERKDTNHESHERSRKILKPRMSTDDFNHEKHERARKILKPRMSTDEKMLSITIL